MSFLSDDLELFFSLLPDEAPWLERHVSVFERKLFWKLLPVGEGLERDAEMPEGEMLSGGGALEMGMVDVGVDVPEVEYGVGGVSQVSEFEEDEEWPDERDFRERRRCQRSLIDMFGVV